MNPVVVNALVATTASEATKLATSIVEYKKATYAIDAELAKAELDYKYQIAQIENDVKKMEQALLQYSRAFNKYFKSIEKDKKKLQRKWQDCMTLGLDFRLSKDERQEAKEMAQDIRNIIKEITHKQQEACDKFNGSVARATGSNQRHYASGVVIDTDYTEIE